MPCGCGDVGVPLSSAQAKKLMDLGKVDLQEEMERRAEELYTPNWFCMELKTGVGRGGGEGMGGEGREGVGGREEERREEGLEGGKEGVGGRGEEGVGGRGERKGRGEEGVGGRGERKGKGWRGR